MRFIKDREVRGRKHPVDLAARARLERKGRQIEMVVHDHDLAPERFFARGAHEAVLPVRAFVFPKAVFARARHQRPQGVVFGHRREFRAVARRRNGGKALDFAKLPVAVPLREEPLLFRALETIGTDVVGAALEHRCRNVDAEGGRKRRDVLLKELILEGLPGRGNHDDRARKDRRNQIGEAFARAGAGLGEKRFLAFERLGDRERKFNLALPGTEPRRCAREGTVLSKGERYALGKGFPESKSEGKFLRMFH